MCNKGVHLLVKRILDQYKFLTIYRSVLFRIRTVSDKRCRGNQNTRVQQLFFTENRAVFKITWKNIEKRGGPQMTNIIWRMRIARWIIKATNTHTEYVILIAFALQQWLQERALMLRYTYISCLLSFLVALWSNAGYGSLFMRFLNHTTPQHNR